MKTALRFILGTLLGIVLGGGAVALHFSGRLTEVYHKIGLHSLAAKSRREPESELTAPKADEHAGMPGMVMNEHAGHATSATEPAVSGRAAIVMSPLRQQAIGVKIGAVERDRLLMSIRAVGIIEPDQTRLVRIQTRISGWVAKAFVNYVGQDVKRGDPLLEIYSPDLLATQEEYLVTLAAQESMKDNLQESALLRSTRRRLELWGVPDEEIDELKKTRKSRDTLVLRSPIAGRVLERNLLEGSYVEPANVLYRIADLSVVWLQAKIYEYELPHIEVGQKAMVSLLSEPAVQFEGRISFVEPIVEEMTRTVRVRVEIANQGDAIKPGMYADLRLMHDMGEGLLVPDTAVLRTGERAIAYRALSGDRFEPVEVKLGGRFGDRLEVLEGLAEGEKVLISAVFLVDSESRLRATSAGGAHHHH